MLIAQCAPALCCRATHLLCIKIQYTYAHTHIGMHECAQTYICAMRGTLTSITTHTRAYVCARTRTQTHTETRTHARAHTHTSTQYETRTHVAKPRPTHASRRESCTGSSAGQVSPAPSSAQRSAASSVVASPSSCAHPVRCMGLLGCTCARCVCSAWIY